MDDPRVKLIGTVVRVDDADEFFKKDRDLYHRVTMLGVVAEDAGIDYLDIVPGRAIELSKVDITNCTSTSRTPNIVAVSGETIIIPTLEQTLEYGMFRGVVKTMVFGAITLNDDFELDLRGLQQYPVMPSRHKELFSPVNYFDRTTKKRNEFIEKYFTVYSFSDER